MRWRDLFGSAVSGLFQHKLRTLLTLMGVTLGSLLLFLSLSGGFGVISAVNNRLSAGNRLLEITVLSGFKTSKITEDDARKAGFTQDMSAERRLRLARDAGVSKTEAVRLSTESLSRLESIKHVQSVWARIRTAITIHVTANDRWSAAHACAVPPELFDFSKLIVAGRDIADDAKDEVIVSELFLYQLGIQTDEQLASVLGTTIRAAGRSPEVERLAGAQYAISQNPEMKGVPPEELQQQLEAAIAAIEYEVPQLKIVGVFRRPTIDERQMNPDLSLVAPQFIVVVMPYRQGLQLITRNNTQDPSIHARVLARLPEQVKSIEREISDMGFQTQSLAKLALQIRTSVLLITAIISAIAAGALLISAIGITNTMIMNVMERRREIAIMKAIGARDRDVKSIFLLEGMLVGILGGTLGLLIGWASSWACGNYIRKLLEERLNEPFGDRVFSYPLWLLIGTPVLAAIVTTLATYVPAKRAAAVDPVGTLRSL